MKYAALVLALILSVFAAGVFLDNDSRLYSRDLGCEGYDSRAQEICRALGRNMEWEWLGHAIIAPGWRVTFKTMRQVYCERHVRLTDIEALREMAGYNPSHTIDWRLENGAVGLLALLQTSPEAREAGAPASLFDAHSGTVYSTDSGSVFNPENPAYILRGGCPVSKKSPD